MIPAPLPTECKPCHRRESWLWKNTLDETLVEAKPPGLFHTAASGWHQELENTGIHRL
jgi:hypothetical protein